jgi:hypothetical protein
MGQIPLLPAPVKNREQLGQDLQPVGDYAGVEPYYRICVDAGDVQHHEQNEAEAFISGNWWWGQHEIRFLNGKAFIGLSFMLLLIPYAWGGLVLVGGGVSAVYLANLAEIPRFLKFFLILAASVVFNLYPYHQKDV